VANADMPGGSTAGGDGSGSEHEAAWLDLVARFDAPAPASGNEAPWPEREDLAGPVRVSPADALPEGATRSVDVPLPEPGPFTEPAQLPDGSFADGTGPFPFAGVPGTFPGTPGRPGRPSAPRPAAATGPGSGPRDAPIPEDPDGDRYVPPPAPPLPKLDPVTKGAWLSLFGGPLYLIVSTVVGSAISGLAAFIAVAAFVGGFAVIVLRMDSGPPKDGPDDGAVV
jgi:hypothetical protein